MRTIRGQILKTEPQTDGIVDLRGIQTNMRVGEAQAVCQEAGASNGERQQIPGRRLAQSRGKQGIQGRRGVNGSIALTNQNVRKCRGCVGRRAVWTSRDLTIDR
ncbi:MULTISPECIES: hypothetical protein, partial [Streptomyces]